MAIKGSLKEASLPDVLQLLALGQKTGCLALTDRNNLGYVYFDRGKITYASIVNRRDRLGDMLLGSGKIDKVQLDDAVRRQDSDRDRKLGELLVESGQITREELEQYMRVQVEEAVFYLFTWTRGSFQFDVDVAPSDEEFLLSINPESLLLEGARRVDEWSLIEKKIPSLDLVFKVDSQRIEHAEGQLTETQRAILPLTDGQHSVAMVVEESGLSEFDVGKALYGLLTAGLAQRTRSTEPVRQALATDARVGEHKNLGVAFYKTGMYDEAIREFRRVVDLDPENKSGFFYLGLVAIHGKQWAEGVAAFRKTLALGDRRPASMYNMAYCLERSENLDEAEHWYAEAVSAGRSDHRLYVGWAMVALQRDKLDVAQHRLESAREVAGEKRLSQIWYWAQSLTYSSLDRGREARETIEAGLEKHPTSGVLRNNLAVLLEMEGRLDEAGALLQKALAEGVHIAQLAKNLGDIQYRQGNHDGAREAYERAVHLDEALGDDVYFRLGNIAYKHGDVARASVMWHRTLELNRNHELARANLETMKALAR